MKFAFVFTFIILLTNSFVFSLNAVAATENQFPNLTIREIKSLRIISDNSELPLTVANTFPQTMTAFVQVQSESLKLEIDDAFDNYKVEVPANSETKLVVPVHIRSNGEASLRVVLKSATGFVFSDFTAEITLISVIGKTLFVGFILLVTLLLFFGGFRTIQAHKKTNGRVSSNLLGIKK